jgi:hypothetical protein
VKEAVAQTKTEQEQLLRELGQVLQELEWLIEQSPACVHRSAGKKLITSCQDGRCDPTMFAQALDGLRDEQEIFIAASLDPERGAESLQPKRLYELERLFIAHPIRPMTRLVVVVLPKSEGMADVGKAEIIKAGLLQRIRDKLPTVKQVRSYGATVSCSDENSKRIKAYASRKPPSKEELAGGKKLSELTTALLFRLDCW